MLRKFLTAYGHRVEGIGAIGSGFQSVFLRLGQLLSSLILLSVVYTSCLNRCEELLIVLNVKHWYQVSAAIKHTIDEKMLQHMIHRLANVNTGNEPSISPEGIEDDCLESRVIHGIGTLLGRGVEIKYHPLFVNRY